MGFLSFLLIFALGAASGVLGYTQYLKHSGIGAQLAKAKDTPSSYDKGISYAKALEKDKPILAFFYVDWCGFCKRFAPNVPELRKFTKANKMNFVMINCEDMKNRPLMAQYKIQAFPTFYIIDTKRGYQAQVVNYYPAENLKAEVSKYLESLKNDSKKETEIENKKEVKDEAKN